MVVVTDQCMAGALGKTAALVLCFYLIRQTNSTDSVFNPNAHYRMVGVKGVQGGLQQGGCIEIPGAAVLTAECTNTPLCTRPL